MLLKKNRLTRKADFARVRRFGQRFFAEGMDVFIASSDKKTIRAGLVVNSRFFGKAAERNRLKRMLREIFRQEAKQIRLGADIVVSIGKNSAKEVKYAELKKTISSILKKTGQLQKNNNIKIRNVFFI